MASRQLLWLAPRAQLFQPYTRGLLGWELLRLEVERNPSAYCVPLPTPRIGILDLSMVNCQAMRFLRDWIEHLRPTEWLALLRQAPAPGSVCADLVAQHCADFHTLPWDDIRLRQSLGHLWGMACIKHHVTNSARNYAGPSTLDGPSAAITRVRTQLRRYSQTREPVMILGASGTGKESAARFIHDNSPVRDGPFVVVHCAALPEALTQSELFGHEKGAFTSADRQRIGRIEAAQRGTLLLDGIDELLPQQQSVLLRFLQEGRIERLGSHESRSVNARVISTCSLAPAALINESRLRADLYYRLSVLQVTLPPLRERIEDLSMLIDQILNLSSLDHAGAAKKLGKDAFLAAIAHDWPGNIRELQNRLRRAALLSDSTVLSAEDMGLERAASASSPASCFSLRQFRAEAEQQAASHALAVSNHNVSAAARLLNISRLSLYRLMQKYGLERSAEPAQERGRDEYRSGAPLRSNITQ